MAPVEPFDVFLARTRAARPETYAVAIRAAAHQPLSDATVAAEFERMKAHILSYYEDVRAEHSFLDAAQQPVDCVPAELQPARREARRLGLPDDPTPPPARLPRGGHHTTRTDQHSPPPPAGQECPPGAVMLPRITLEQIAQFGTLDKYFQLHRCGIVPPCLLPGNGVQ